ncbi:MAG: hypothetical protein V1793_15330 [Pseudomonadota bacterium]
MEEKLNWKQKMVVVIMDILLIIELVVSIGIASQQPGDFTFLFIKLYVPALLITVITGRICIRKLQASSTQTVKA